MSPQLRESPKIQNGGRHDDLVTPLLSACLKLHSGAFVANGHLAMERKYFIDFLEFVFPSRQVLVRKA